MAYPPAGRVLGLGIRQLLTPPTYLLIWDTSSGSGFSSGNMSALLLVHGVITVRISRRWTCQLRWAKLRITASVMHERNASSGSVLGINWVALLVRHFTEIPPVCGVCNVTSRDVGITCQLVDLLPSLAAIGLLLAFIWQAALGFR